MSDKISIDSWFCSSKFCSSKFCSFLIWFVDFVPFVPQNARVLKNSESNCCQITCKLLITRLLSVSLKHVMLVLHPADFLEVPWKFIGQNVWLAVSLCNYNLSVYFTSLCLFTEKLHLQGSWAFLLRTTVPRRTTLRSASPYSWGPP